MPEVVGILEMTWPLLLSLVRSCVYARNKVVSSRGPAAPSLAIHGPFDERDFARVMRPHRIPVRLVKPDIALKKQANTLNLRLRSGRGLVARHECPDWVKNPTLARNGRCWREADMRPAPSSNSRALGRV
jgi:hypothetical protein